MFQVIFKINFEFSRHFFAIPPSWNDLMEVMKMEQSGANLRYLG